MDILTFTIEQDEATVKAAHRFQTRSNLRDVRLLQCRADGAALAELHSGVLRLGVHLNSEILHTHDRAATIAVEIRVTGDSPDAEHPKTLLEVVCRYGLSYDLVAGYDPAPDLEAFKDGNAVFHAWPYCRELVQNLTMRMGASVPPLPMLRLAPKASKKAARSRTK